MSQAEPIGLHTFLLVAAILLFLAAGISWMADPWPWRLKLIALGLFCWSASTIIHF
jgi:hypothetical protein